MLTDSIIVAIITGGLALAGTVISNLSAHSKTMYRIEQLEKKQDLHNSVITRMYEVEKAVDILDEKRKVADNRIRDLEEEHGKG
nr:MAG TPA: hemolysin [Caudoviricetes sp.]